MSSLKKIIYYILGRRPLGRRPPRRPSTSGPTSAAERGPGLPQGRCHWPPQPFRRRIAKLSSETKPHPKPWKANPKRSPEEWGPWGPSTVYRKAIAPKN